MYLPNTYKPTEDKRISDFIYKTSIDGLYFIQNKTVKDQRGFFSEVLHTSDLEKILGHQLVIKQVNHSRSAEKVIRGIHSENWNKYVTIGSGVCFSAIVDVRPESPTFGNKEYFILGYADYALDGSLFIPIMAGNSMCVLEGPVDYIYFVDALYRERNTSNDTAISLFDPDLNIEWPFSREKMIISERDLKAVTLREKFPEKFGK